MDALTVILFVLGLVLLIGGAEILVRGASSAAVGFGISPLVVGLTVVAFGTSAPELSVSLISAWNGGPEANIAMGNVIGSNIANVLLILGLSAAITPLVVSQQLVRLDVPILVGVSMLTVVMSLDGRVGRPEGAVLFMGVIAYTVFAIRQSRKESRAVREEYEQEFAPLAPRSGRDWAVDLALVLGGLVLLMLGSRWLVNGAVSFARIIGVSELVIGLTVVAIGTSLPEVATSGIAAMRGERDIAVGNVVGSNLFNLMAVLGLTAVIAPQGVPVSPAALHFDLPVMVAVAVACLPVFWTGYSIARWEGLLFLAYYAAYLLYVVLAAMQHDALQPFSAVMMFFVIPLTVVTLAILAVRFVRRGAPA